MNNLSKTLVVSAITATLGLASSNGLASDLTPNLAKANLADSLSQMPVQQRIALQQAKLSLKRQQYAQYFDQAYKTYPVLPQGILESLAFVASRWDHQIHHTEKAGSTHHHMPQAIGLFGLFDTNKAGFTATFDIIAKHANIDKKTLKSHPESYIMATASYLASQMLQKAQNGHTLESSKSILSHISGLPRKDDQISRYAINSFLYDFYKTVTKGQDDNGIQIKAQEIKWEKVFTSAELKLLRAPGLVIEQKSGQISVKGEEFAQSVKAQDKHPKIERTTDYGPALWYASPNYSSRSGSNISHVAIHTTQGSYSGAISWLANTASSASAHYVIRSSDGQVTQMVRDSNKAWHARSANPYSIGIEHEGYVSNSSWYTDAMYTSSANLTKHMCSQHNINCANAYSGAAHSTVTELSQSYTVKGHQHFPSQSHTDPGIYWDWSGYHSRLNGGSGGGGNPTVTILDDFETSEGSFDLYPTYSGSTTGISSSSTAVRTSSISYNGNYSEQLKLVDNSSSSSSWAVRFLSNSGSSSQNTKLTVNNGKVGFWVYSGGSGLSAAIGMDDSDGTERSTTKTIPANQWTFLEWELDNSSQWNPWYSGNGALSASQVSIDAIWFFRAQTSYNVYLYIDDVQYSQN